MSDLMRVPEGESRVTRAGREAVAGGAVTIIAVAAVYLLVQTIVSMVIAGAVILVIGAILWFLVLGRRGKR
jgi:lipopolysaccharide export LptBFGC system permease protein LptF